MLRASAAAASSSHPVLRGGMGRGHWGLWTELRTEHSEGGPRPSSRDTPRPWAHCPQPHPAPAQGGTEPEPVPGSPIAAEEGAVNKMEQNI